MPGSMKNNFLEGGTALPSMSPGFAIREAPSAAWHLLQPRLAVMERVGARQASGTTLSRWQCTTLQVLLQGCFLRPLIKRRGLSHILTGDWTLESDLGNVPGELQRLWERDKGLR